MSEEFVWHKKFVGSVGYRDGVYSDRPNPTLTEFSDNGKGFKFATTNEKSSSAWAWWTPDVSEGGLYEIQVYIPHTHATTRNARYHLHGVIGREDFVVPINQADFPGEWVSLGIHEIDPTHERPGRVNLNNLTGEPDKEIAFTGIRWRVAQPPVISTEPEVPLADGFSSPVGLQNPTELGPDGLWLDAPNGVQRLEWYMSTDYNQRYKDSSGTAAIHTGVDLNLNPKGEWNKDRNQPVYAIASGEVTFAEMVRRFWGNIVVIRHDPLEPGGQYVYSRYAHLRTMTVIKGQRVCRSDQIGNVGSNLAANGVDVGNDHLHFDISPSDALLRSATDWPKLDQNRVLRDYVDPKAFIVAHRPT
jgi:murein DD-endopeptidase MepM/ murein hydrolase activator NlpD